ncbi:MAG: CpsD/CapB family tyrosine-protein kinase [Thermodesulfobacteriota bacterium]
MRDSYTFDIGKLYSPEAQQIFANVYDNLMLAAGEEPINSVLVCAADPGEGATTVALGLGLAAVAKQTRPILIIDGNFHDPCICQALGLTDLYGLGELAAGRVESCQAVIQRAASGLDAIGAGIMHPNHILDLEPPNFNNLLNRLAEDYALVIVDGPPVNVHPESVLYSSQVDQVIQVVYAGVTRVPVLSKALSKLTAGKCKKVDILLNRRIFPIPEWIYNRL